jgi:hypothetical protein
LIDLRFPLAWPPGWPRTSPCGREDSRNRFKGYGGQPVTFETARKKLCDELEKLRASTIVISTNLPLRNDGFPRAEAARMRVDDPGVAIYFALKKRPMVMACDRYDAPSANLRSVGLAIEAMRQLERHGGGAMMEKAFEGFAALPAPMDCWQVLGIPANSDRAMIEATFRSLAQQHHPDRGGSTAKMAEINQAREAALKGFAQ